MNELLRDYTHNKTLKLVSVEAFEHESNSAICHASDNLDHIGANSE